MVTLQMLQVCKNALCSKDPNKKYRTQKEGKVDFY